MNHDNSRLIYREIETRGQPLVSQAQYHNAGPVPAQPGNEAAIFEHQQLAVNSAIAAGIEWVGLVERNSAAKAAVESTKAWRLQDPRLEEELQTGLALELSLSCAAGRWDGEDPPAQRGMLCKVVNEEVQSFVAGTNPLAIGPGTSWQSELESLAGGIGAAILFPSALQYGGKFWDIHSRYHLLDQLTNGFSSSTANYSFGQDR